MCGIIGYIGPENFNKDKIVTLMVYNQLKRGDDSTGIYTVDTGIIKSVLKADLFIETEFPNINEQKLFIGHVRKRTSGVINKENAHPFQYDNLIGVHNGSVTNTDELYTDWNKTFSVDSQVILYRLATENNPKVLQELDGGTAILVYRENEPNVMYAYNNGGRELYYGEGEKDSYYISSIKESLAVIGCKHIEEFKKETLYKIGIADEKANILSSLKLKVEPKKKKISINTIYPNTSYSRSSFTTKPNMLYFSELINDDVRNIWARYIGKDFGVVTSGKFYKIREFNKDKRMASLSITDTSFTKVPVTDLDLDSVQKIFTKDELVMMMGNCKNKSGDLVVKENQIVTVTSNEYNSKTKTIDIIDDKGDTWYIPYNSVRSLTQEEKDKHLNKGKSVEDIKMIEHPILNNVLDNITNNKIKTMTKYTGTTEERLEKLIEYLELYTKAVQDVINDNQSITIRGGFMAKHTSMLRIVDKFKDSSKLLESDINRLDTIMK